MNLFQILIIAAAQQALCKQAFDLGTGDRKLLGQKFISSDFQVMRILDMDHPAVSVGFCRETEGNASFLETV